MDNVIRVGVVEAQTFVARELINRLARHPGVRITALQSMDSRFTRIEDLFGELRGRDPLPSIEPISVDRLRTECHAAFLCLPHGEGYSLVPDLLAGGLRVFDLSSDFRLRDRDTFRRAFGREHPTPELNRKAIYGLPELYRPDIFGTPLVAIPGNYPTAAILALAPLMKRDLVAHEGPVIIDCKGGYSSAERLPANRAHLCSAHSNMAPHFHPSRHQQPEIEEQLQRLAGSPHPVILTPHFVPTDRGTLATCYVRLTETMDDTLLHKLYRDFYNGRPFIRVLEPGREPETRHVLGTNFCDLALRVEDGGRQLVAFAALDNLLKGSAGQAIQCMNFSYNLDEKTGLW